MRLAAVGDLHVDSRTADAVARDLGTVGDDADLLLLAGDLTERGELEEAELLGEILRSLTVPVVAVVGNHDCHAEQADKLVEVLEGDGVTFLAGNGITLDIGGTRLGIAGSKGFCGGFAGAEAQGFGERIMKEFVEHTRMRAERLEVSLRRLGSDGVDVRIALLHYAPIRGTLEGEPVEFYAFLGSQMLGDAIDRAGADLVLHGHAHHGREQGTTRKRIPVRNVARPVLGCPYRVFDL